MNLKSTTACLAVLAAFSANAQMSRVLNEVAVTPRRALSEIGLTKTAVDSAALRENISLSMADVLGFNSSLFVKSSGRATLSTVAFRGTAPSHTAVSWNGLPINSPALGMTDFSLIPAYFIDRATLLHGASSMTAAAGGLGGMVDMSTSLADLPYGVSAQYVQGLGSYSTFDEFIRIGFGSDKFKSQTRAVYSTSANDFKFYNTDRYEFEFGPDGTVADRRHPTDRNRNGSYGDFHLLQQLEYAPTASDRLTLDAWLSLSDRNISPLMANYGTRDYENNQREDALRATIAWSHAGHGWRSGLRAGYIYNRTAYNYGPRMDNGATDLLTESRTHVNSLILSANFDYAVNRRLYLKICAGVADNHVRTRDLASLNSSIGFNEGRTDIDASASMRWQPAERIGLSALIRQDITGGHFNVPAPAAFADYLIVKQIGLSAKASIARNFRAPTINDLYFQPGGNPDLKNERGWTYDIGLEAQATSGGVAWNASATWFDSRIDDWILWLPTIKGFFSPRNVKKVHSFGAELTGGVGLSPFRDASLDLKGSFSYTRSVNDSPALSEGDKSVGKQLPYVPEYSASASAALSWRRWSLMCKICYYSKRYTMSSNEESISGSLPDYFMSNAAVERTMSWRPLDLSIKCAVNNLFNTRYQTIMGRPMPGINFEIFVSVTPHF